MFSGLWLLQFW